MFAFPLRHHTGEDTSSLPILQKWLVLQDLTVNDQQCGCMQLTFKYGSSTSCGLPSWPGTSFSAFIFSSKATAIMVSADNHRYTPGGNDLHNHIIVHMHLFKKATTSMVSADAHLLMKISSVVMRCLVRGFCTQPSNA